jgi:hypothetical protein
MTTQANLYVDQGTDYVIDLFLTTNDGEYYPVDNKQFYCSVKKLFSSAVSANVEISTYVNSETEVLELYLAPETTRNLDPGKYTYDVIMVTTGGTQTKILEGLMFILPTNTVV